MEVLIREVSLYIMTLSRKQGYSNTEQFCVEFYGEMPLSVNTEWNERRL